MTWRPTTEDDLNLMLGDVESMRDWGGADGPENEWEYVEFLKQFGPAKYRPDGKLKRPEDFTDPRNAELAAQVWQTGERPEPVHSTEEPHISPAPSPGLAVPEYEPVFSMMEAQPSLPPPTRTIPPVGPGMSQTTRPVFASGEALSGSRPSFGQPALRRSTPGRPTVYAEPPVPQVSVQVRAPGLSGAGATRISLGRPIEIAGMPAGGLGRSASPGVASDGRTGIQLASNRGWGSGIPDVIRDPSQLEHVGGGQTRSGTATISGGGGMMPGGGIYEPPQPTSTGDLAQVAARMEARQTSSHTTGPIVPQYAVDEAKAIALDIVAAFPEVQPEQFADFISMTIVPSDRPLYPKAWAGFLNLFGADAYVDGRPKNWWEFTDTYHRTTALFVWQGMPLSQAQFLGRVRARSRQQSAIWIEEEQKAREQDASTSWSRMDWSKDSTLYPHELNRERDPNIERNKQVLRNAGELLGYVGSLPGAEAAGVAGGAFTMLGSLPDQFRPNTLTDYYYPPRQMQFLSGAFDTWALPMRIDGMNAQQLHDWIAEVGPVEAAREMSCAGWRQEAIGGVLATQPNWGHAEIPPKVIVEALAALD